MEAFGGFWDGVQNTPTFVPLDEFMSERAIAEDDLDMTDLVLEHEFEFVEGGE